MKKLFNVMLLQILSKKNKKKIKIEQEKSYTGFILGDDAVKSYSTMIEENNHKKSL